MTFDVSKFAKAKFERRTEAVEVTALSDFFPKPKDPKQKPTITVQGLTHHEVARCAEGMQSNDNLKALLEAAAGHKPAIKAAVGQLLGGENDIPKDTQKRILHLVSGSLEPKIDEGIAVKLAENFPIEFTILTNKILELTGLGQIAVKKQ
jgi:hypothetical protein